MTTEEFRLWCNKVGAVGLVDTTCTQKGCRWQTRGRGRFCFNVEGPVGDRNKHPETWRRFYQCPNTRYVLELNVHGQFKDTEPPHLLNLVTVEVTNQEIEWGTFEEHREKVCALRDAKLLEWASNPENLRQAEEKIAAHLIEGGKVFM